MFTVGLDFFRGCFHLALPSPRRVFHARSGVGETGLCCRHCSDVAIAAAAAFVCVRACLLVCEQEGSIRSSSRPSSSCAPVSCCSTEGRSRAGRGCRALPQAEAEAASAAAAAASVCGGPSTAFGKSSAATGCLACGRQEKWSELKRTLIQYRL